MVVKHREASRFGCPEVRKANEIAGRAGRLVDTRVNAVNSDTRNVYGMTEGAAHFIAPDPIINE